MDIKQYTVDLSSKVNDIILKGYDPLEEKHFESLNTFFGDRMRENQKIIGGPIGGSVSSTLIVIVDEKRESRQVLEKIVTRYRDAGWKVTIGHLGDYAESQQTVLAVTTIMYPGHKKGALSPSDVGQNVATDQREVDLLVDRINTFLKAGARYMSKNALNGFAYQNVRAALDLFKVQGWEIYMDVDKDGSYYEFSPKKS